MIRKKDRYWVGAGRIDRVLNKGGVTRRPPLLSAELVRWGSQ